MAVHSVYAQISNEEVKNIAICKNYEIANRITRAKYGSEAFAVECNQYPCQIGDKYIGGIFYHMNEMGEMEVVEYVPTEEQAIANLNAEMDVMNEYMVDLDYQTAMLSLGL